MCVTCLGGKRRIGCANVFWVGLAGGNGKWTSHQEQGEEGGDMRSAARVRQQPSTAGRRGERDGPGGGVLHNSRGSSRERLGGMSAPPLRPRCRP